MPRSGRPPSLKKHTNERITDPAFFEGFPSILKAIFESQKGQSCLLDTLDDYTENYFSTQLEDAQSGKGKNVLKNFIRKVTNKISDISAGS